MCIRDRVYITIMAGVSCESVEAATGGARVVRFMPNLALSVGKRDVYKRQLFSNPVIRPCNLAIRNAWMSGGVEWNCGIFGHHVHTCDTLFCAKTELDDGTPVLRFYEFERIRRAVVQMDFFLPEGSRFLYARMRITNPNPEVIPMYWWSNIAVPEDPDGRVITWANGSYINGGNVSEIPIPINDGKDVSYPVNTEDVYKRQVHRSDEDPPRSL